MIGQTTIYNSTFLYFSKLTIIIKRIPFILSAILLILLPFHAFLVTWFSDLFLGSNSDFLPKSSMIFASWKELLILLLGVPFIYKWIKEKKFPIKLQTFDYFFFAFLSVAILTGIFITKDISQIAWGLKYDFSFFILFYLIRGIAFDKDQKNLLLKCFFASALVVMLFGLITYLLLPPEFLQFFGYSEHVSSFNPDKPLPMYHILGGGDATRLSSTFSGPNHFGFYLIIVVAYLLSYLKDNINKFHCLIDKETVVSRFIQKITNISFGNKCEKYNCLFVIIYFCLVIMSVFLTYSRSAWLAIALVIGVFVVQIFYTKKRIKILFISFGVALIALGSIFFFSNTFKDKISDSLVRQASTSEHFEHTATAFNQLFDNPLGVGIGKAGPASIRFKEEHRVFAGRKNVDELLVKSDESDVFLIDSQRNEIWHYDKNSEKAMFKPYNINELNAIYVLDEIDPYLKTKIINLWKTNHYETIAENWHIQMFQEYGFIGGVLYLFFIFYLMLYLYKRRGGSLYARGAFLALCGFLFAGMFLHVFEDSSSSLTLFLLLGLVDE